jgi:hypothetical protein
MLLIRWRPVLQNHTIPRAPAVTGAWRVIKK